MTSSALENLKELAIMSGSAPAVDICRDAVREIYRLLRENKELRLKVDDLRAAADCANGSWY